MNGLKTIVYGNSERNTTAKKCYQSNVMATIYKI